VTIGAARLAAAIEAGPAIDSTRDAALTFSGSSSVTIAAGQEVISDPVNISYNFGEKLAVSVYLKGTFGPLTQHTSEVQTNFENASGSGNATSDTSGASMSTSMTDWLMVNGIDVYGSYQGTVAIFGSSSVDGHNSSYGSTNSYPTIQSIVAGQDNDRPSDWLARQLRSAGYRLGVLNAGAIGDPAGENASTAAGASIAGIDRMQHDVLEQPNIKTVIIYFGGVDLRSDCKPATDVEASLTNMAAQAQAAGVRVILATIPPSEYCTTSAANLVPSKDSPFAGDINPGPENPGSVQRRAVNDWIRTSGAALPSVVAIADFDKVLAYPAHPDFMMPNLNSGDNFHPDGPGYGVQSSAIPLEKILAQ
jgi:lysophospholipase L1-like esterase